MRGLGPEEGVLGYEPSVGITHGRLGLTGSYKCWFAVMPLSLKAPYSPGRAAAAVWFCLMMVSGSHAPPGEGSWDALLCHTPHRPKRSFGFCFVCLSLSVLTVIWSAGRLGPTPLLLRVALPLPFGLFESLNFHLFSVPLFLLLLLSQLTALGTKRTRSLRARGFFATPQRNMSVCFLK